MMGEGLVKFKTPKNYLSKKHFFNPKVELSRDLTILVLNTLNAKDWILCDALASIGVRGIRIAKECPVKKVWINDIREDNIPFMKKNAKLNSVSRKVKISNKDANELLSENIRAFDYIDIDPYGSPSYYFDSATRAIKKKGFLGFSATDTAALSGTSPITCLRRYGIESYKTDFFKELAIRILITNAALSFSKWSFSLKPLLSFASQHYFRVFAEVKKGKSIASKNVKNNLGYVSYCEKCLWRKTDKKPVIECEFCGSNCKIIGRIWIGNIEDLILIQKSVKKLDDLNWLNTERKIRKILYLLNNESLPFYYNIHKLCQKHRLRIPSFKTLQKRLKEKGYRAERTHFSNVGIKTNSHMKDLLSFIKKEN
jgi:tRNA (guanine26-N2/guanine27-N2)-dimethyltransferase